MSADSITDLLIIFCAVAVPIYGLGWIAGHHKAYASMTDRIIALKKENENLRVCLELRGEGKP